MKRNKLIFICLLLLHLISCNEEDNLEKLNQVSIRVEDITENRARIFVETNLKDIDSYSNVKYIILYRRKGTKEFKETVYDDSEVMISDGKGRIRVLKDLTISTFYETKVIVEYMDRRVESDLVSFNTKSLTSKDLIINQTYYPNERIDIVNNNIDKVDFSKSYLKWSEKDSLKIDKVLFSEYGESKKAQIFFDENKVKQYFIKQNDPSIRKVNFELIIYVNGIRSKITNKKMFFYSYFPSIRKITYSTEDCYYSKTKKQTRLNVFGHFWRGSNAILPLSIENPKDNGKNMFDDILIEVYKKGQENPLSSFTMKNQINVKGGGAVQKVFICSSLGMFLTNDTKNHNFFHQTTAIVLSTNSHLEKGDYILKLQVEKNKIKFAALDKEFKIE